MTVDNFIRTFKDVEVDIRNDTNRGLVEVILPNINYMFYRFNYEQILHMSDETAFFLAYGLYKTLILLDSEKCKKWAKGEVSGKEKVQSNMGEESRNFLNSLREISKAVSAVDTAVKALIAKVINEEEEEKQKTGKWLWDCNGRAITIQCSECKLHYDNWAAEFNYCPHCGAKMRDGK